MGAIEELVAEVCRRFYRAECTLDRIAVFEPTAPVGSMDIEEGMEVLRSLESSVKRAVLRGAVLGEPALRGELAFEGIVAPGVPSIEAPGIERIVSAMASALEDLRTANTKLATFMTTLLGDAYIVIQNPWSVAVSKTLLGHRLIAEYVRDEIGEGSGAAQWLVFSELAKRVPRYSLTRRVIEPPRAERPIHISVDPATKSIEIAYPVLWIAIEIEEGTATVYAFPSLRRIVVDYVYILDAVKRDAELGLFPRTDPEHVISALRECMDEVRRMWRKIAASAIIAKIALGALADMDRAPA